MEFASVKPNFIRCKCGRIAKRILCHPPVMFMGAGFASSGDHYEDNQIDPPIPEYENGVATDESIKRQMDFDKMKDQKSASRAVDTRWKDGIIPRDGNDDNAIPEPRIEQEDEDDAPGEEEEKETPCETIAEEVK